MQRDRECPRQMERGREREKEKQIEREEERERKKGIKRQREEKQEGKKREEERFSILLFSYVF